MSMDEPRLDDDLLSAYVDGELGAVERERVEVWLREHLEDRQRVFAWRADREALAASFDPVLDEPIPETMRRAIWRRGTAPAPRRWAMAAGAAGLVLLGALLGGGGAWQWQEARQVERERQLRTQLAAGTAQGWVQRAALAHQVFTVEPRHAVEVRAQEEHLARWLTRRIEIPVKLFDLQEQGFELVGGRLLPDGPGKSAQLMYQDAAGRRVTVYLRKPEQGTDAAFRYVQQDGLGMFYWVEEGAGYALVGDVPKATLLALAQAIYRQHPKMDAKPASAPGESRRPG